MGMETVMLLKDEVQMLRRVPFLSSALDVVLCHHERWDGTGYPRRLKGEAIPLSARMDFSSPARPASGRRVRTVATSREVVPSATVRRPMHAVCTRMS